MTPEEEVQLINLGLNAAESIEKWIVALRAKSANQDNDLLDAAAQQTDETHQRIVAFLAKIGGGDAGPGPTPEAPASS